MLENLLKITDEQELRTTEEKLTKQRAKELIEKDLLSHYEVGTFRGLATIHRYLFKELYPFAGKVRTVDITKGSFSFAPMVYLDNTLKVIDAMPQTTFDEIVEKYVEMNVAHPFREGNGRSTRLWLDQLFKTNLQQVIAWEKIAKDDYLNAMILSPVDDSELKKLLYPALTDQMGTASLLRGIDASYSYEDFTKFSIVEL